jgi:hypothetical protein
MDGLRPKIETNGSAGGIQRRAYWVEKAAKDMQSRPNAMDCLLWLKLGFIHNYHVILTK